MKFNCGIIGLPNVGKSTIFSALTSAPAEAANYPFCTIDPNVGIVNIPDSRLQQIADIIKPKKMLPSVVEFVDIAGLVKGASKGEGLGNQFLGHIREVGALAHVVRCYEDDNVTHVSGKINPKDDIEIINYELALADLESVNKRLSQMDKLLKSQDKNISKKARITKPILENIAKTLEEGNAARSLNLSAEDLDDISDVHLLTLKKQLYVCNVAEENLTTDNDHIKIVREIAKQEGAEVVVVCGKIEAEIAGLDSEEDKLEFLESVGITESGLHRLIKSGFDLLGLRTFFTAGEQEVRSWTFKKGDKAPDAAAVIHTDFKRGFIKAETYHCEDLFSFGSEQKIKENGKMRMEGKEYVVNDGDVIFFRFNV